MGGAACLAAALVVAAAALVREVATLPPWAVEVVLPTEKLDPETAAQILASLSPVLSRTGKAVAGWQPSVGVSPWEVSNLEEADIMKTNIKSKGVHPNRKWPNKIVPFTIEAVDFTKGQIMQIRETIRRLNGLSCLTFREAESLERDVVHITGKQEGCYTEVSGRKGGEQQVNLQPPQCLDPSTIYHELLHVAGFRHQHNAPNRDVYVKVFWLNINKAFCKHFTPYERSENYTDFGLGYDLQSIMHFSPKAYTKNGKSTILPREEMVSIGRKVVPSAKDIEKLNLLYEC